ncbi:MAG: GAF domain-containing protein [Myxococcota bacterium]|nr:GAF domain-containing protein [Myxococcota bacterium]
MPEQPADLDALRSEVERLRVVQDATERRLRASHAVARVLSEATTVEAALPRILGALGGALGCALGSFWMLRGDQLVVRETWTGDGIAVDWAGVSTRHRFAVGDGLPGRVWQTRGPVWIDDITAPGIALPRRDTLAAAQIRSGFGFPVAAGSAICGVIELFTRTSEAADDHLVEVLRAIGGHLGQFMEHLAAKHELEHEVVQRQHMVRAGELFSQSLEVGAVLTELAKIAVPWLGELSAVHLLAADTLTPLAVQHANPETAARMLELEAASPHTAARPTPILAAAQRRETQYLRDVSAKELAAMAPDAEYLELLRSLDVGSFVAVPIIARGALIGTFTLVTSGERRLSTDDVALAEELVRRAALAVANARLYEAAHATAQELDVERQTLAKLDEVGRTISAELDQQALAQAVIDAATEITGAQLGAFFYGVPGDLGDPRLHYAVSGASREVFAKLPVPRNTQLLGPTFGGGAPVRVDDVTRDPRYGKNPPHGGVPAGHPVVKSYLAVPVASRSGQVLGSLFLGHPQPGMLTERAQRLAVGLAAHAATGLDNARLFAEQQRLIKELEKTNAELDQFAYAASHDLRAPLRGISNLASWVEEDLGVSTPKKVREHIALLKGRATRMDRLINGLLELARVGRTRQKVERVDVTELLHETIDLLSAPEASRILIIGAMPTMIAERFALQQVFLNLIGNAVQHSGRKDVLIRITATERDDEYEFAVSDNGIGIAPEHHERVWQIFQTLQARDVVESTGIGLAIVKKQVEGNGGRAWIDPVGPGATLRFTWPKRGK